MVSIDEEVLDKFDKNLGLVRRSASITELMRQENERVGGKK